MPHIHGWTAAQVVTFVEHLGTGASAALSHSRETGLSGFQDRGCSPHGSLHGLYRTLILAHGWHVT